MPKEEPEKLDLDEVKVTQPTEKKTKSRAMASKGKGNRLTKRRGTATGNNSDDDTLGKAPKAKNDRPPEAKFPN